MYCLCTIFRRIELQIISYAFLLTYVARVAAKRVIEILFDIFCLNTVPYIRHIQINLASCPVMRQENYI